MPIAYPMPYETCIEKKQSINEKINIIFFFFSFIKIIVDIIKEALLYSINVLHKM
tara:strand:- start:168 stop:332 length:165 start_codon:yes stop_codon:yes gene_type:complete